MGKEPILLSISVLTSRKEHQVRRCLESLKPLREAISCELIVVDTSEDEHMREVVSEYADIIVPFHWIQDFSAARNAGIQKATGKWFMYLDDDEWFTQLDEMIEFFQSGEYKKYNGATYIQRNYINHVGTLWDDDWVSRMIKLRPETHMVSPIHEYFEPPATQSKGIHAVVDHYGYVFTSKEQSMAHFERNHKLIQKMMDEKPDDARWPMQMMLEYNSVRKYPELLELGNYCLRQFRNTKNIMNINAVGAFYAAKHVAYEGMKDYENVYKVCEEALADPRTNKVGRAYFYLYKGECEFREGRYKEAEKDELEYVTLYEYFQKNEAERIMLSAASFIMQAFTSYNVKKGYSILICAGLRQRNPKYLKKYLSELELDKRVMYLNSDLVDSMVEAMAVMDQEKLFVKALRTVSTNEDVWEKYELAILDQAMQTTEGANRLAGLLEKAEIQSSFVKLYSARKRLSEDACEIADGQLEKLLKEFADLAAEYYDGVYAKKKERTESELPGDYRAALFLKNVFEENEPKKRIIMLRDVVEAYPPFAETMKQYARYLGNQLEKEEKNKAPEKPANPQLEEMASQVLGNVKVMLDAGMTAEAYGIVKELRTMMPDNDQIKKMEEEIRMRLQ